MSKVVTTTYICDWCLQEVPFKNILAAHYSSIKEGEISLVTSRVRKEDAIHHICTDCLKIKARNESN